MKKDYTLYSEKLVQRVNELFHDYTKDEYDCTHLSIIRQKKEKWERIAKRFINFSNPVTIVDLGTGTGFVPLTIAKFLNKGDIFICSDISKVTLDIAIKNIKNQNLQCDFKFTKLEVGIPYKLPFETNFADVVTMNSVLHHIKDTYTFLNEVDRILKPNSLLFIAHEPNRYFHTNIFLTYNYLLINNFIHPRDTAYKLLKKLHLEKMIKRIYRSVFPSKKETVSEYVKYEEIKRKINEILIKEKLIKEPLSDEIWEITDIKAEEGFRPDLILPNYKLLFLETYNHIHWVTIKHYDKTFIRKYDKLLKNKFPKDGATFFIALKKKI